MTPEKIKRFRELANAKDKNPNIQIYGLELKDCLNEIERLHKIILDNLSENDDLGAEYTYVMTLKAENSKLRSKLNQKKNEFEQACKILEANKIEWELE